ncbi:hypothetical protein ACUW9Z_001904, partial [Aerococcus sp. 150760007-1]
MKQRDRPLKTEQRRQTKNCVWNHLIPTIKSSE